MTRPIGFYVHHDGQGHLSRAARLVDELGPARCAVFTSHPKAKRRLPSGTTTVMLDPDTDEAGGEDRSARGCLHHAPLRPDLLSARARQLLDGLSHHRCRVVVVDVSVEVSLLVRLLGYPVVAMRMRGERLDAAHRLGYDVATAVLAPFPALLDSSSTAPALRRRTTYCGLIGRSGSSENDRVGHPRSRRVGVVWGEGVAPPSATVLDACVEATPGWDWWMVGSRPEGTLHRIEHLGWVDDVVDRLRLVDVIVGPPGDGVLCDVVSAGRPFVATAMPRPFDEQLHTARSLEEHGLAVGCEGWPAPTTWPLLLKRAGRLDTGRYSMFETDGAAARAAAVIEQVAVGTS